LDRQPRPSRGHNERLFEFLRGHDRFRCELRDHGQWGVEAQINKNEEFLFSYRLETREMAAGCPACRVGFR
jgi:hypothetical protein